MKIARSIAAVCLMTCAFWSQADEAQKLQREIQKGMNAYCAAVMKKDFAAADKAMKAHFSPKATIKTADGRTRSYKEWTTEMKAQMAMLKSVSKMEMKIKDVKVNGNKATSKETFMMVATIPNMSDPKKTSKLEVSGNSSSTYEKVNGKWLIMSSTDSSQKVLIDGKPMG